MNAGDLGEGKRARMFLGTMDWAFATDSPHRNLLWSVIQVTMKDAAIGKTDAVEFANELCSASPDWSGPALRLARKIRERAYEQYRHENRQPAC